jgi:hypothetical protein
MEPPGVAVGGNAGGGGSGRVGKAGKRLSRLKRGSAAADAALAAMDASNDGWRPRPRRVQLVIEPVHVTQCPAPFVTLAMDAPPALLLGAAPGASGGGGGQAAVLTSETAATNANGVAGWTNNALTLTVTLHRSGVYEDDPFLPARCGLELREPVARGHLHARPADGNSGAASPPAARAKPLCTYGLDLSQYCDPHSDVARREHVLQPEGRDLRSTALTVVISSCHCEEVPVSELQRCRELARLGEGAAGQTEALAEQVDMLMTTLESTHAKLLTVQDAEAQAVQLAEAHRIDAEDLAEQLRLSEAKLEEFDAEHAKLRALAALPAPGAEPGSESGEGGRVGVEPETFLALQRDLVRSQRDVARLEPLLQEARAQLRQLSMNHSSSGGGGSGSGGEEEGSALPRMLQRTVDILRDENDTLWRKTHDDDEAESLRHQVCPRKRLLLKRSKCHFIRNPRSFAKTGSGQTQEKHSKRDDGQSLFSVVITCRCCGSRTICARATMSSRRWRATCA